MRRSLFAFLFCLLFASPVFAQAITRGPVPAGTRVAYEAPSNVTTVTDARSFEPRFYRGGVALTAGTNVTCGPAVAPVTGITCSFVLNASNLDAVNQVGVHALTLSLFRQDVGEGPQSVPFTLTTPAGAPTGGRLTP